MSSNLAGDIKKGRCKGNLVFACYVDHLFGEEVGGESYGTKASFYKGDLLFDFNIELIAKLVEVFYGNAVNVRGIIPSEW